MMKAATHRPAPASPIVIPPPAIPSRRLIVNADDFGRSASINTAVIRAHREGILTSASLMMNEAATAEAVALAKANPKLGVGLHLTLVCGHAALEYASIPELVNTKGEFRDQPVRTGCNYFFRSGLRAQLRAEIHEQFARFRATDLPLDHVNGHLHFHLHPVVFKILMQDATDLGITHLRLTRDRFWLNARSATGRWVFRTTHSLVFATASALAHPALHARGIKSPSHVFGVLQDSRVDEEFICRLLPQLPPGDAELYAHPSLDHFRHELEALISPRVKSLINELGIQLIRYQDL